LPQSANGQTHRNDRRISEEKQDYREPAQHDYDRILYSSALRRLGGVTQVVAAHEGHVFHNRLTHSLRVAQLSRRLAQKFIKESPGIAHEVGGIDPDVAEAAGLAHDLGHPPFGHIAEEELRSCVADERHIWDGFEGNAQSFRIVTTLTPRFPSSVPDLNLKKVPGLNLTRATLNAILKYPWTRQSEGDKSEKYGLYQSEIDDFKFARKLHLVPEDDRKGPETEIMDWADDVTYAVHDAEDFYRAGLIPLDRLASLRDGAERKRFFDGMYGRPEWAKRMGREPRSELEESFLRVITQFPLSEPYSGTRDHRSRLRLFSSELIGQFVNAIELHRPSNDEAFVKIVPLQKQRVRMLKALTWFYVIYNPALATQQYGQRQIVKKLFEIFGNAVVSRNGQHNIVPLAFREEELEARESPARAARIVADLIASMTEQGAVKLHRRLTGIDMGSILDYKPGS
jgi:dGTPase